MHIEMLLDQVTLRNLIQQFAPIRIHMTPTDEDRRWLELDEPETIELVPEQGVRVVCKGRARYSVGETRIPIGINKIVLLLAPVIGRDAQGWEQLEFRITIENADLKYIPGLIDRTIFHALNKAITPESTHMIWSFSRMMTRSLQMPERLEPLDAINLEALHAEVRVEPDGVRLHVDLGAQISRTKARPSDEEGDAARKVGKAA
jgi:hypothetical protein